MATLQKIEISEIGDKTQHIWVKNNAILEGLAATTAFLPLQLPIYYAQLNIFDRV